MSIKNVVTRGFGFAGGVGFIPPLGFSPFVLSKTLPRAFVAFWRADADLPVQFIGGIKINQSNFGDPLPRAVLATVGRGAAEKSTGRARWFKQVLQLSVYADKWDKAEDLAYLVQDKYEGTPLVFGNGYLMAGHTAEPNDLGQAPGPGSGTSYHFQVEITYTVGRNVGPVPP